MKRFNIKGFIHLWIFAVIAPVIIFISLILLTNLQLPDKGASASSITISELKDEIKKGREFYLNIDENTRLRFKPNKSTWWITETRRNGKK